MYSLDQDSYSTSKQNVLVGGIISFWVEYKVAAQTCAEGENYVDHLVFPLCIIDKSINEVSLNLHLAEPEDIWKKTYPKH